MKIHFVRGINSDYVQIDDGQEYRYGYNVSYSRDMAAYAHSKHECAIKYHWDCPQYYPEKPFIGDILTAECGDAWMDPANWDGYAVFSGKVIDITDMVNRMKEEYEQV